MLTHAVEFRDENRSLAERHDGMETKIKNFFNIAKNKLTADEYELFEISYKQCRNFAMFKDIMGEIDTHILPLWFELLDKLELILSKTVNVPKIALGPGRMFYKLIWFLPADLKAVVLTPDLTPFNLETL